MLAAPEDHRELLLTEDELVCPSCGNLRSECSDPERAWYPQREMCYATAAREMVHRRLNAKHKADRSKCTEQAHPLDGMAVWVSLADLSPDDRFV